MPQSIGKINKVGRNEVIRFLEGDGHAISAGDLPSVAACWEVPALVLSDDTAIPVTAASEIERFFEKASASYRAQGLVATKPELERLEELSGRIASVDVRWLAFDSSGAEQSSERSHYILHVLHVDDIGHLRIRVALTMSGG